LGFSCCHVCRQMPYKVTIIKKVDVLNQIVYTINMIYEWDENKRLKNF
jgi:hypothetical protein